MAGITSCNIGFGQYLNQKSKSTIQFKQLHPPLSPLLCREGDLPASSWVTSLKLGHQPLADYPTGGGFLLININIVALISANYMPGRLIGFQRMISFLFKGVMQESGKRLDACVNNITIHFM